MNDTWYKINYELFVDGKIENKVFQTQDRDIFNDMMKRFTVSPIITVISFDNGKEEISNLPKIA